MSIKHHQIIIIGSGPAGYTAAIYAARANLKPLLIQGSMPGGQLTTTTEVENFPGFVNGIMGPDLMLEMENQAKRFGCEFQTALVEEVNLSSRPYQIKTAEETFSTDALIIATGANPRYLGLPNEKSLIGFGVSTCATCDGAFFREQTIAVVGGGDSACEEALFLTRFAKKVYLIHRRDQLRASKIMQDRVFKNQKIEIIWDSEVTELVGEKPAGLKKVVLTNTVNHSTQELELAAIFMAIGHVPNSQLFQNQLELDSDGYLVTEPDSTKTKIAGVFACGDVRDKVYRQAITAAGSGCMAAIEAERYLESL